MKIVDFINSPGFKKGAGIVTIIFAGICKNIPNTYSCS